MRMEVDKVLNVFHGALLAKILPALGGGYEAGSAAVIGMGLNLAAQEYDCAVEELVADNNDVRQLFGLGLDLVKEESLRVELAALFNTKTASLRVSELSRENHALNRVLIDLHVYVEEHGDARTKVLETAILEYLKRSAERRSIEFPAY